MAGACLVGAGIAFWIAWFLMPLPGTNDAAFILEQVGAASGRVFASVAIQMLCCALFVPGLAGLLLAPELRDSSSAFVGVSLAGIGVTGFAADAIYHLVAFEMSRPGIPIDAMLPVMARLQSVDLVFIAPQLLALAAGVGVLASSASRAALAPRRVPRELLLALGLAVLGGAVVHALGAGRRALALAVLALLSLAIAELGAALRAR
ncbi:MAG TPA: hypothetical protein VEI82_02650 [Myxococcota bacterium]|nr:hypothetical protein [Myxococcota bacterium]